MHLIEKYLNTMPYTIFSQFHTIGIKFYTDKIQFYQNENSISHFLKPISNIHGIALLSNSEQLFCYKLHHKISIDYNILNNIF